MAVQFTIGVFGLIFGGDGRVLLCHRCDYDLWNLPGGGLEAGESPWDGVKREVKEETGLDVDVSRLAGVYSKPDKNEIVFSFVCNVTGGEITLNDEADQIEYFEVDGLPANMSPKQIERIRETVQSPDQFFMVVQTGPSSIELLNKGKLSSS